MSEWANIWQFGKGGKLTQAAMKSGRSGKNSLEWFNLSLSFSLCVWERNRERQGETETGRERDRQGERDRDRKRGRERERERQRQTDRLVCGVGRACMCLEARGIGHFPLSALFSWDRVSYWAWSSLVPSKLQWSPCLSSPWACSYRLVNSSLAFYKEVGIWAVALTHRAISPALNLP